MNELRAGHWYFDGGSGETFLNCCVGETALSLHIPNFLAFLF